MANYRQIHVRTWKDPWFINLSSDERLLFIYLITNENTSLTGIYELPRKVIDFESGLDPDTVTGVLQRFAADGKVFYENDLVWVVNMRRYHETSSSKVQARLKSDFYKLPECELKTAYWEHYHPDIPYPDGIDTLSLKEEEEDEEEVEVEEAQEFYGGDDDFPDLLNEFQATAIFTDITDMVTIPHGKERSREHCLEDLYNLRRQYDRREPMVDDGKRYYDAWCKRKYLRTNTGWFDWWIAREIPPPRHERQAEQAPTPSEVHG